MSENVTEETNGSRSFEERVFARFDVVDDRFDRVEGRLGAVETNIGKLEARHYDTKPIWEQALAAITETNTTMREGFDLLRNEFRTEIRSEIESLRTEMKLGFAGIREEMERALHGVERKIDVLNHNILDLQAEQRHVDNRLEELESQTKPT